MMATLYGNFGFVNKPLINVASNIYMPKNLYEKVIFANNLKVIGNNKEDISGGGISFDLKEALISAFGEYAERYSSSFQINTGLYLGSYESLSNNHLCYNPDQIKYFSEKQYLNKNFGLKRLDKLTEVHWIKSRDYLAEQTVLLPFFMTNVENIKTDGMFHINTTTGTACHISTEKVIESGLLECIERDAFCKFWYLQKMNKPKKFSAEFILNCYKGDNTIDALFNNRKLKIISFDISEFAYAPTFVTFIYFKKKNKIYQSVGSGTRLKHRDALIKSCIEAYQGIEYIEVVCKQNVYSQESIKNHNFNDIDSFRRHYALYNVHPELITDVPLLQNMFRKEEFSCQWQDQYPHHIQNMSKEELSSKGLDEIYYTELTTSDVKEFGLEIGKVVTPKLHLLTGNFNYPYLGLFDDQTNLMTEMPHPFP